MTQLNYRLKFQLIYNKVTIFQRIKRLNTFSVQLKTFIVTMIILLMSGCFNSDPAIKGVNSFIEASHIDKTKDNWKSDLPEPDLVTFDEQAQYFWDLETSHGKLTIKLLPEIAPKHVTSTIYLTTLGFYDDIIFHRVIRNFMAQGGDPLGTGQGNPGYKYDGEFSDLVRHDKPGLLSMANAGPGTDGSQFFITFKPTPWLDDKHTIFGEVVDGLENTLKTIEKIGSRSGRTSEEVKILKASIRVEK